MASFFLTVFLYVSLFILSIQQLFFPIYYRKPGLNEGLHTDYLVEGFNSRAQWVREEESEAGKHKM